MIAEQIGLYSILLPLLTVVYVSIFQAKFQMECERDRRNMENSKNRMHEELMSKMARTKATEEFERERTRKIKEMKELTETVSETGLAMAETNDRLSYVHADLKNAFQMMRVRSNREVNRRSNEFESVICLERDHE